MKKIVIIFAISILLVSLLSGCNKDIIHNEKVDCISSDVNLTIFTMTGSISNFTLQQGDTICLYKGGG